jgi:4-hydroxyphenylpyruvate dioxygenase
MGAGYAGPISLEIFNDQFQRGMPRLVAQDGHRSLVHLMDAVRRTEPQLPTSLPDFPGPVAVEGVVEFATTPDDAQGLEGFLASAGFQPAGRHRSKQVRLWRQGGANLLVNTEPAGYAHAAWLNHGTGVSEVGLTVADPQGAMTRATFLDAPSHAEIHGPGELSIPGIRGVGAARCGSCKWARQACGTWILPSMRMCNPARG